MNSYSSPLNDLYVDIIDMDGKLLDGLAGRFIFFENLETRNYNGEIGKPTVLYFRDEEWEEESVTDLLPKNHGTFMFRLYTGNNKEIFDGIFYTNSVSYDIDQENSRFVVKLIGSSSTRPKPKVPPTSFNYGDPVIL